MQNASYYLKSARHQFAKTARKGDGGVAVTIGAALTAALSFGGVWMLADEAPDHQTTPQTETVLAEIQSDLTVLQKDFATLNGIETRLETGDYTTAEYQELQTARRNAANAFDGKATPVLDRILFTPHLSEAQAENLMTVFENTVKDPAEINDRYDIADYGFLRDKRDDVIKQYASSSVENILDVTAQKIDRRNEDKWFATGFSGIPIFILAMVLGACLGDSRRLKNWAREKPAKHIKAKH
ncbi:MAG: hypothetical protein HND56_00070 [Pseudomonadota bacterium]|jgi:hypothetical protein|nr:hypothetical protein [Pseudomonadota bacterium]QKK04172.1 MAG: hypothetical protein HND56_00070 [Pseudomonadota bacterium]